jgi:stage II sporulation protein D
VKLPSRSIRGPLACSGPPPWPGARRPTPQMLLRALAALVVLSLAATASASTLAPAAEPPPPSANFFVTGRGWGHGVGMSQWGAYVFAQRGVSYERILAHYYRGTELGKAPIARVRVLLGEGRRSVTIRSATAFRVRDGSGALHELQPGAYTFGPGLKVRVDPAKEPQPLTAPLLFSPGSAPLEFGRPYRGQIVVNAVGPRLQVINYVGLEQYLFGVVPREVPFTWPMEALKAQAVVARSYALAVRKTGAFDLYADTRSQVYGGVQAEKPSTNAAVDATAGRVLLYGGRVATTFFFSTSGGRTANISDVWDGGQPLPYLVSVPDPYDSASPHHAWGPYAFTAQKLAQTFRVAGRVVDVRIAANASQRVETVTFVNDRGGEYQVMGSDVRTKLNLRSTWFRIGVLALQKPAAPIEYGGTARLTGLARGATNVKLEQRAGAVWEPASRLKPRHGVVTAAVKPLVSTDYRLAISSTLFGPPVRVLVAPRVRLHAVTDQTVLRGVARPAIPGARVEVLRLAGGSWRTVATTRLDATGEFEARLRLSDGSYRARVAPGRGLVPGYSPVLKVVSG